MFVVRVIGLTAEYSLHQHIYDVEAGKKAGISGDELESFIRELDDIGVLNWKAKYTENCVLDGEDWELEMIYNGTGKKKIYGNNQYPGPSEDPFSRSQVFKRFLESLGKLVKEPCLFDEDS